MADSKAVRERIEHLITQAAQLSKEQNRGAQMAWLTAAENSVLLVSPSSPYSLRAKERRAEVKFLYHKWPLCYPGYWRR